METYLTSDGETVTGRTPDIAARKAYGRGSVAIKSIAWWVVVGPDLHTYRGDLFLHSVPPEAR